MRSDCSLLFQYYHSLKLRLYSQRLTASSTDLKTRCKVSVMAQGAAEVTPTYPHEALLPVTNHFYHPVTRSTATRAVASIDAPVQPVRITPLEYQVRGIRASLPIPLAHNDLSTGS